MSDTTPRLKVVNLVDVPRGGWRYRVVDTNTVIQAGSINELKRRVLKHMAANSLVIPRDMDEVIEDGACHNLELGRDHWCQEREDGDHAIMKEQPKWRATEILRFLRTIWDWGSTRGFDFVPPEESERRAQICVKCPANVVVTGCLGCTGVAALARKIRGDRKTSQDTKLHTCNVCACLLQVKVLVPLDVIDNRGLEYPSWCWQNPTQESLQQQESPDVNNHEQQEHQAPADELPKNE